MIDNLKINVVIPFYSNADWLDEALNSVIGQTVIPDRIIVVNDGSPEDITYLENKYMNWVEFYRKERWWCGISEK